MKTLLCLLFALLGCTTVQAGDTISLAPLWFQIDHQKHLVVINRSADDINATWPSTKTALRLDTIYSFAEGHDAVAIGQAYMVTNAGNGVEYTVFFTQLPVVSIVTEEEIGEEDKVPAYMTMTESNGNTFFSHIGIRYRGSFSMTFPKKSFKVEFWENATGEETVDVSLLGLKPDDECNLQAMYNEPLRMRSKTNNELWRMIHSPYYQNEEPLAVNGLRMEYMELFLNGTYRGIYCMGEEMDRKQLRLKNYNGNIRGELYKGVGWGASTYSSLPPYNNQNDLWGGFEYKHPKEVTDWANLHAFVSFVINSTDADFVAGNQARFQMDNAVDYFIFLNLLRATDNTGKNLYVAKYTAGAPYFFAPWDLDGTFGIIYSGAEQNITDDILSNGFYNRLMADCSEGGFVERLKERWNLLRGDIITTDALMALFQTNYNMLQSNGIYEREAIAWDGYDHAPEHLDYMSGWTAQRIAYLDATFHALCLQVDTEGPAQPKMSVHPNPTLGQLRIEAGQAAEAEVRVWDAMGRTVLRAHLRYGHSHLDLSRLTDGVYFVQVTADGAITVQKVVLRK